MMKITQYPWKSYRGKLSFPMVMLSLIVLLSGCRTTGLIHSYINSETGIKLERPYNWSVEFYERNGMIVLRANSGILNKDSARIEILAGSCPTVLTNTNNTSETLSAKLEHEIKRYGDLFSQQVVHIIEQPTDVKNEDYGVKKVAIEIPTMSMGDSARIQVGHPEPDKYQIIDIFVMQDYSNENNVILVSIFRGDNKILNVEAQEIVESIHRVCTP